MPENLRESPDREKRSIAVKVLDVLQTLGTAADASTITIKIRESSTHYTERKSVDAALHTLENVQFIERHSTGRKAGPGVPSVVFSITLAGRNFLEGGKSELPRWLSREK